MKYKIASGNYLALHKGYKMKVTITNTEPDFKPFNIIIKVETEQELINLWAIFNSSVRTKVENCYNYPKMEKMINSCTDLIFGEINNKVNRANYKG